MSKRKAILFEGVEAFCEFIRAHGAGARSQSGYAMYRVSPPEQRQAVSRERWVVLFGYHPRRKLLGRKTYHRVDAVENRDRLELRLKGLGPCSLPIRSRSEGRTLTEFITLIPWRTRRPEARQLVYFWLRDPELLTRLVSDSMALRNDRIRYAPIKADGRKELLVRVEQPSVYLLQLCREEFSGEIGLYYPGGDDLFLPWGHDYPLIDLWEKHRTSTAEGLWRFFSPDGGVTSVPPVRWQDIYDASEFDFGIPCESSWLQDEEAEHRIRLTLRNEGRNRPVQPEMWMLSEEERPQLEALLSAVDESDLDNLVLSIQQGPDGRQLFFVREKHTSGKRKYFDFTGQRLATYKGYSNLFLPTDAELQPQLRRDQYPHLFELKSGELTVMLPPTDDRAAGRLLRLSERSFNPLRRYIDYLIEGDREVLEDVMAESVFDFAHYARAPSRPDLTQRKAEGKRPRGDQASETSDTSEQPSTHGTTKTRSTTRPGKRPADESLDVVPTSELERQEQELEAQVVSDPPTSELWAELMDLKRRLNKTGAAATCGVEALWLTESGPDADQLRADWRTMLTRTIEAVDPQEEQPVHVAARVHHGVELAGGDVADVNTWLQQAITNLRDTERQFRVKERWLLWGELLKHNRDHVEQARVRQQILDQLGIGLSHEEVPDFIRAALMRSRRLDEDSGSDLADAAANLRSLEEHVKGISDPDLRLPTRAMTARAYSRIGLSDRARRLCEQLVDDGSMNVVARCLTHLFAGEALASIDEAAAGQHSGRYRELYHTLSGSDTSTLDEIEQSLAERRDAENVAELLSAENYRLFFPTSARSETDPQLAELVECYLSGEAVDFESVFSIVNGWFDEDGLDQRALAQRTRQLVRGLLTRMQWGSDGPRMVAAFEKLIARATAEFTGVFTDFYDHLLAVAFAQGLIQLGQDTRAAERIKDPIERGHLALLDVIDVCSARLTVIESMRLRERSPYLVMILNSLTHDVSGVYVTHALRVLDQTIEAAVSKDKFAAQKFQQYIDHEEFMIRQRVLSEDFCQRPEPGH